MAITPPTQLDNNDAQQCIEFRLDNNRTPQRIYITEEYSGPITSYSDVQKLMQKLSVRSRTIAGCAQLADNQKNFIYAHRNYSLYVAIQNLITSTYFRNLGNGTIPPNFKSLSPKQKDLLEELARAAGPLLPSDKKEWFVRGVSLAIGIGVYFASKKIPISYVGRLELGGTHRLVRMPYAASEIDTLLKVLLTVFGSQTLAGDVLTNVSQTKLSRLLSSRYTRSAITIAAEEATFYLLTKGAALLFPDNYDLEGLYDSAAL